MSKRYYINFTDEVWGGDPAGCVSEINEMEDSVHSLYMTLPSYSDSFSERIEVISSKSKNILKKYNCKLFRSSENLFDLEKRGELDDYIAYSESIGCPFSSEVLSELYKYRNKTQEAL